MVMVLLPREMVLSLAAYLLRILMGMLVSSSTVRHQMKMAFGILSPVRIQSRAVFR